MRRVRVMPVTARSAKKFTAHFPESAFQPATVIRRVFAHRSGGEDKLIAEGRGNGAAGFQEGFEMDFSGLLKAEKRLAAVASMRMAAGKEAGFGNPHAVCIQAKLDFRDRNNHGVVTLTRSVSEVKGNVWHQTVPPDYVATGRQKAWTKEWI